jgi:predicted ferric reductase
MVKAEEVKVEYKDGLILDQDLDGLTDEGELQLYGTNPYRADSDQDSVTDGAEVLALSDPVDPASTPGSINRQEAAEIQNLLEEETPWAWYISRASGMVAFLLLYFSMFLGLAIRLPILNKIISPADALRTHSWISVQAVIIALFHGIILTFDKLMKFSLVDVFLPFASKYQTAFVGLGVMAFYLMLVLIVTSYLKRFIPHKLWRVVHYFNMVLYAFVFIHAMGLGTDLKNPKILAAFLVLNALLALLIIVNILVRIITAWKRKTNSQNQKA